MNARILNVLEKIAVHCKLPVVRLYYLASNGTAWLPLVEQLRPQGEFADPSFGLLVGPDEQCPVFACYMARFPFSCGICVAGNTALYTGGDTPELRGLIIELQEAIAVYARYTTLIYTDITRHGYQLEPLKTAGFKSLHALVNKRTTNTIHIMAKDVN